MTTPSAQAPPRRVSSRRSALSTLRVGAASSSKQPTATSAMTPPVALRWRPCDPGKGPELVVTQGDLTAALVDAIVVPVNGDFVHAGGLAAAVVVKGGSDIEDDCEQWLEEHGPLAVGQAMTTRAGKLPCRYVIHAVGPSVGFGRVSNAGADQMHLRNAVRSALCEAKRLRVASVALPVISSGHFEFPVVLAATEIVNECVRYAMEKGGGSTLQTIALMGGDGAPRGGFESALQAAAAANGAECVEDEERGLSFHGQVDGSDVTALKPILKTPKLRVPKLLAPRSSFETLKRDDPEYQRILKSLPHSHRVLRMRRVLGSARHAEFEKLKAVLEGTDVKEVEPLYHGTPAMWRAKAIALQGFDRNIRPGGPTHVAGVYTSKDVQYAHRFTQGGGSLLVLRGLVVSSAAIQEHNTIIFGDVHVFPTTSALVATMIIDYMTAQKAASKQAGRR